MTTGPDSLWTLLERNAATLCDRPALLEPGGATLSHSRLRDQVDDTVRALNALGIGRGDRVALVLPQGPELAAVFLGVASGATGAPLNPAYRAPEFEFYLKDLQARAVILQQGDETPARDVARSLGVPIIELQPERSRGAGCFLLSGASAAATRGGFAQPDEVALVLHTSGTTSRPKLVPLTHANLCCSARAVCRTLHLQPGDRCLNVMPLFHIHGLVAGVLATLTSGGSVICAPPFEASRFFAWLQGLQPTWYTAVPTMHRAILAQADSAPPPSGLRPLRFVRSSSAALPPAVLQELERVFGAPVIEAYGMTEAAHQMTSNPLPPGARKPGSVGPAAGPEVAVADEGGDLLSPGRTGEIVIRGANVTPGYEHNPVANATAFTSGWFRTGDQGYLDADGYLFITGRLKEIINRGGEKVAPREIDEALLSHPGVQQAVAFATVHPTLGEDIAAAVVAKKGASLSEAGLREFTARLLPGFKVPSRIVIVEDIPKGATGKVQRVGLADRLAGELAIAYEPPRAGLETLAASLFEQVLSCPRAGRHDNFFALGGDSLRATQVAARLRKSLGLEIPATTLFMRPTPALLAAELSETTARLSPAQRRSLEARLKQPGGQAAVRSAGIPRGPSLAEYPLSFAQERMWLLQQIDPVSPVYNRLAGLRLRGALDVPALERSLGEVVRRHEVLRASFHEIDGRLVQRFEPARTIHLPLADLRAAPKAEREERLRSLADAEARLPFNLEDGPLFRASLARLDTEDHALLLNFHHAAIDGWSLEVLTEELAVLYGAMHESRPSPLPDPPIRYVDFALWQRDALQGPALSSQLDYWRQRLAGAGALDLPTDRPRRAVPSTRGESLCHRLPPDLVAALNTLCRAQGVTLFMGLLAGFTVLLQRYTGQEDIVVGVPVAGRTRVETERLIGCFINTLAIRTDLGGNPTVGALLQRGRDTVVEAFTHQELPFEKLVAGLNPDRDRSRTPVFQALFQWRDIPRAEAQWPGLIVRPFTASTGTAKTDVSVDASAQDGGISLTCEFNADLFDAGTVARMLGHFETLLAGMVANPLTPLADLPMLSATERHRLLVEWNRAERGYPRDRCVHQLFEEQVERTPEAVAVLFEGGSLTYRQLNARANRIAHRLRSLGVGPDVRVGLCGERSPDLVAALLGILKAGGAYVPLDPHLPRERLAFLLGDVGAPLVLTQRPWGDRLPAPAGGAPPLPRILALEELLAPLPGSDPPNLPCLTTPGNLAYVMYTSGTTGQPKGVMVPHLGVVRLVISPDYVSLTPGDVLLQYAPLAFDASTFEIWGSLLNGARLVVLPPRTCDFQELGVAIATNGVTVLWLTAALFHRMLEHAPEALTGVRQLLAGGDVLSPAAVRRYLELPGHGRLINGYGPTENTTFTCCCGFDRAGQVGDSVSIGRPIAGTNVYILDSRGLPVPAGVTGEIHAGGDGLARGYLNAPELTAERFIADPFSSEPGARLYRTGDLARHRPDGNIEFVGRRDHQVKIRGFRVELGEIEHVLRTAPGVRDCAVAAFEERPGEKRLAAFLVVDEPDAPPSTAGLREFLSRFLPDSMNPSAFVVLDKLPLTANGKVDRTALAKPAGVELAAGDDYAPARSGLESDLVEIWQAVLRRDRVGVRDNFFHLGGHSLSAVSICAQASRRLNVELPLRWLFEHPTIELLALRIDSSGESARESHPIRIAGRHQPPPMSFAQQGMWLLHQTLPDPATYYQPVAFRLSGRVDRRRVRRALQSLLERHEVLRTALVQQGDSLVQEIAAAADVPLPWQEADLRASPPGRRQSDLEELLLAEARRPFDLAAAPLWRALWVKLAETEHVVEFTFHHGIVDEWTLRLFFDELQQLCAAEGQAGPNRLPELSVQYADYAVWQRRHLSGDLLERQRRYWREQLRDVPPSLHLPTDRARPTLPSGRGARHEFRIPAPVAARLRDLAREEETTAFAVLLTAFQLWLHRCTGQTDVVVGTPVTTRERPEFQSLIGFFLNTLPIRTRLEGSAGFRQVLRQVRATLLEAFSHADLPFEQIVELTVKERAPGQQPLFQVMFVLLEEDLPALRLDQAEAAPLAVDTRTSKSDLTLSILAGHGGMDCRFEYATDLFSAQTAGRMASQLTELLHSVAADPDKPIGRLELLPGPERERVLVEWNRTRREYPREKCVHQLFEEQAERTPDEVAVEFNGRTLTYADLNRRANRLAHHLMALGAGADVPVALGLGRSLDLAVGLLGILKAGSGYVPLDPAYPPERLAFVIADSGSRLLVTCRSLAAALPAAPAHRVVLEELPRGLPEDNPGSHAGPEHLAYLMYTSGSTGQPKGVAMGHRPLTNLVTWQLRQSAPAPCTLQFSSTSFDVSFQEFFATWLSGGRLVLAPEEVRPDPARLWDLVVQRRVERLFLPAVVLEHLAAAAESSTPVAADLKEVVTAGEQLRITPTIRRFFKRHPAATLCNQYGPTETHVVASFLLPGDVDAWPTFPPIGAPIANVRTYVLDDQLSPLPIGVPGELFFGGVPGTRGYWNRPELTADRFLADPFCADPEAWIYRSGDRGRWLHDGNLEFLGRLDEQMKIRGFRVELGEIETVLRRATTVRECVVAATGEKPDEKRLVAYLVPADAHTPPEAASLRELLGRTLPGYMVPSAFVVLDELPLTPNGKVDRKALPRCDFGLPHAGQTRDLPRTPAEAALARIWAEVLKIGEVGLRDNFFHLGGHSLLAAQVVSRIRREFALEMPVRALFECPTIEALAILLLEKQAEAAGGGEMERLLLELEALPEEAAGQRLLDQGGESMVRCGTVAGAPKSAFHCPGARSAWFGRRRCNLLLVVNEDFEVESFERVARQVRDFDPLVNAVVLRDQAGPTPDIPPHPTLTFSPAVVRHPRAAHGRTFSGYPLSKSEEYRALEEIGIRVPRWVLLREGAEPDLGGFAEHVVRKPDFGGKGAEVKVLRKERVRWKPIVTRAAGTSPASIVQEFVYTGPQPVCYRVNTLFGKVLYSVRQESATNNPRRGGATGANLVQEGGSIVASARGCRVSLNFDDEIIRLGEAAAGAFPEIPLLGFDIIREVPSGALYVLEANAIGYVWSFYSAQVAEFGFSFEVQFDGVRKAAYILAEQAQQHAV